jgi:predicted CopG family antitoxin
MKTTIQLRTETREALQKVGTKGQSYDEIIRELVELRDLYITELERVLLETPEEELIPLERVLRERGLE